MLGKMQTLWNDNLNEDTIWDNIDFYEETNLTEKPSNQLNNKQIYNLVRALLKNSKREFLELDSPFYKPRTPCVYVLPVEYPFQRYFWNFFNIPSIWYKIGFTNNIERRIKQYNTIRIHPYKYNDVYMIFTPYAEFVERLTHKYLKLKNYKNTFSYEGNEIFPAPFELVLKTVNAFNELLKSEKYFLYANENGTYDIIDILQNKISLFNSLGLDQGIIKRMINEWRGEK